MLPTNTAYPTSNDPQQENNFLGANEVTSATVEEAITDVHSHFRKPSKGGLKKEQCWCRGDNNEVKQCTCLSDLVKSKSDEPAEYKRSLQRLTLLCDQTNRLFRSATEGKLSYDKATSRFCRLIRCVAKGNGQSLKYFAVDEPSIKECLLVDKEYEGGSQLLAAANDDANSRNSYEKGFMFCKGTVFFALHQALKIHYGYYFREGFGRELFRKLVDWKVLLRRVNQAGEVYREHLQASERQQSFRAYVKEFYYRTPGSITMSYQGANSLFPEMIGVKCASTGGSFTAADKKRIQKFKKKIDKVKEHVNVLEQPEVVCAKGAAGPANAMGQFLGLEVASFGEASELSVHLAVFHKRKPRDSQWTASALGSGLAAVPLEGNSLYEVWDSSVGRALGWINCLLQDETNNSTSTAELMKVSDDFTRKLDQMAKATITKARGAPIEQERLSAGVQKKFFLLSETHHIADAITLDNRDKATLEHTSVFVLPLDKHGWYAELFPSSMQQPNTCSLTKEAGIKGALFYLRDGLCASIWGGYPRREGYKCSMGEVDPKPHIRLVVLCYVGNADCAPTKLHHHRIDSSSYYPADGLDLLEKTFFDREVTVAPTDKAQIFNELRDEWRAPADTMQHRPLQRRKIAKVNALDCETASTNCEGSSRMQTDIVGKERLLHGNLLETDVQLYSTSRYTTSATKQFLESFEKEKMALAIAGWNSAGIAALSLRMSCDLCSSSRVVGLDQTNNFVVFDEDATFLWIQTQLRKTAPARAEKPTLGNSTTDEVVVQASVAGVPPNTNTSECHSSNLTLHPSRADSQTSSGTTAAVDMCTRDKTDGTRTFQQKHGSLNLTTKKQDGKLASENSVIQSAGFKRKASGMQEDTGKDCGSWKKQKQSTSENPRGQRGCVSTKPSDVHLYDLCDSTHQRTVAFLLKMRGRAKKLALEKKPCFATESIELYTQVTGSFLKRSSYGEGHSWFRCTQEEALKEIERQLHLCTDVEKRQLKKSTRSPHTSCTRHILSNESYELDCELVDEEHYRKSQTPREEANMVRIKYSSCGSYDWVQEERVKPAYDCDEDGGRYGGIRRSSPRRSARKIDPVNKTKLAKKTKKRKAAAGGSNEPTRPLQHQTACTPSQSDRSGEDSFLNDSKSNCSDAKEGDKDCKRTKRREEDSGICSITQEPNAEERKTDGLLCGPEEASLQLCDVAFPLAKTRNQHIGTKEFLDKLEDAIKKLGNNPGDSQISRTVRSAMLAASGQPRMNFLLEENEGLRHIKLTDGEAFEKLEAYAMNKFRVKGRRDARGIPSSLERERDVLCPTDVSLSQSDATNEPERVDIASMRPYHPTAPLSVTFCPDGSFATDDETTRRLNLSNMLEQKIVELKGRGKNAKEQAAKEIYTKLAEGPHKVEFWGPDFYRRSNCRNERLPKNMAILKIFQLLQRYDCRSQKKDSDNCETIAFEGRSRRLDATGTEPSASNPLKLLMEAAEFVQGNLREGDPKDPLSPHEELRVRLDTAGLPNSTFDGCDPPLNLEMLESGP